MRGHGLVRPSSGRVAGRRFRLASVRTTCKSFLQQLSWDETHRFVIGSGEPSQPNRWHATSLASSLSSGTQWTKKGPDILGEQIGNFPCGEMPAARETRPVHDVEGPLGPTA